MNFIFVILIVTSIIFFIVKQKKQKRELFREEEELDDIGEYSNMSSRNRQEQIRLKKELDIILAKISESGLHSLTDKERLKLDGLSKQLDV